MSLKKGNVSFVKTSHLSKGKKIFKQAFKKVPFVVSIAFY